MPLVEVTLLPQRPAEDRDVHHERGDGEQTRPIDHVTHVRATPGPRAGFARPRAHHATAAAKLVATDQTRKRSGKSSLTTNASRQNRSIENCGSHSTHMKFGVYNLRPSATQ